MLKSENINELAAALSKAQGEIRGAKADSSNPFYKSNYADLASVWEAIRIPLATHGLSVIQTMDDDYLFTTLLHSSGQWFSSKMKIRTKDDSPQAMGSGISYTRRYGLAAIIGVYQIDDDANSAQKNSIANAPIAQVKAKPLPNYAPTK